MSKTQHPLEPKAAHKIFERGYNNLLILFILPILLLLINNSWIFTDPFGKGIDPWVYTGYFLDFSQHSETFQGTYYGSRFGWILPGFFVYKIFPPLIANYLLHLIFFYAALISFYLVLKWTINERAALFSSLLMGTYGHFLSAMGWDYVDGAGITYLLLTMMMLTYAAKFRYQKFALVMAGVFFACMLHSNLFLVVLAPTFGAYYLHVSRMRSRGSWYRGLYSILGIIAATSLLGCISYLVNHSFLFFLPSVKSALHLIGSPNPWRIEPNSWIFSRYHLMLPALIFGGSIVTLFRGKGEKRGDGSVYGSFLQTNFIFFSLVMVFLELRGSPVLQLNYYASYLIPLMFLAFGSWFENTFQDLSAKRYFLVIFVTLAILLPAFGTHAMLPESRFLLELSFFLLAGLCIEFSIFEYRKRKPILICLLIVVTFAFFNANLMKQRWGVDFGGKETTKDGFLAVVKSVNTIRKLDKETQKKLWFWYNSDEDLGTVYRSIASTFLWGYRLVNEKFPETMDGKTYGREDLRSIRNIVILSRDEKVYESAAEALNKIGLKTHFVFEKKIQQGGLDFTMTFIYIWEQGHRGGQ